MQCGAVCYSALQCVAVCCSVLQRCSMTSTSTAFCTLVRVCNTLQYTFKTLAANYYTGLGYSSTSTALRTLVGVCLHHTATHCNTLHHTATHCSTLQHTAAHCSTTYCNIPAAHLQCTRNTPATHLQHTCNELGSGNTGKSTALHILVGVSSLHCSTLQHTAIHLQNTAWYTFKIDCSSYFCSCVVSDTNTATHCNTLQHTATHCNTLQHTATHCNTLQRTATPCNTPATNYMRLGYTRNSTYK